MINQQIFQQILNENKLIEAKDNFLFFIEQIDQKISKRGTNYLLIQTVNSKSQKQKYFFFGTTKKPIKQGDFIYCHISPLGDNWKLDNIYEIIDGSKFTKDLPDCKNCMWNGQAVCNQCQNGSYFQKPQQEDNITQEIQNGTNSGTKNGTKINQKNESERYPDFQNEEEIIEVNSVFDKNPQAEEFWKEYDSKSKKIR